MTQHIDLRFGKLEDVKAIEQIQQHALAVLKDKAQLDPVPVETLVDEINQHLLAVAVINGHVVAYRTMHLPDKDYLGPYVGIKHPQQEGLIYSDITVVDPNYRGLSLQRKLGQFLFDHFESHYKVIMATVHPENIPSLKDKFDLGMEICAMDELYGGKLRFIFVKNVSVSQNYCDFETIDRFDYKKIESLLRLGYRGIKLNDDKLLFGK